MTTRTLVRQLLQITLQVSALAALIPVALCQTITTAEITGTVMDPADKVVIGATVQLKSIDTGESRVVRSNDSGVYRFVFVRPGTYVITGTSVGFKSDAGRLVAAVGQVLGLDLHVKLDEPKAVVLVTDGVPLLSADNANFVYTLSQRQLDLLPLPGGDLIGVAYSAPGVVVNNRFGFGNFVLQGVGGLSNLFTVNGIDDMDPYQNTNNFGASGMLLGANEVREVSIVQNAFEGQYGRQAGAQISYVTKSGANDFHGNLLYNYNGTRLNANDFFANATGTPRPLSISNQYAASLGGRVVRNKVFFFADTEGLRFALPVPNHVAAIPTPAFQAYALKTIQPSQVPFYQKMFDLYNSAPGHDRAVSVTSGGGLLQDRSGKLGCGKLAGTPTGSGGVFGVDVSCAEAWETNASTLTSEWLLSTRVDYNVTADQRVFFRFKTDHGYLPSVLSDISPLFNVTSRDPDYEGQVNHTFVVTPRLVNNFIASATYNDYVSGVPDLTAVIQAFPDRIQVNDGGGNGFRFAQVGAPAAYPTGRRAGQFQIVNDISYGGGRHFLKAGVNYRYNREADLGYAGFVRVGKYTLFDMRDFANGAVSENSGSVFFQNFTANPVFHLRLYNLGAYVQDQWAVTPRIKITAAVRFDRTGNPFCVNRCFARLLDPFPDLNKGLSVPYNQSIQTGLAHAFYNIEPIVPQPRLSLAYSPAWSKRTVFRGGIGVFSDLYASSFAGFLGGNPPNEFTPEIRAGLVNAGGAGSSAAIAAASANAFTGGFASGATLSQLQLAVTPAQFVAPSYFSMPSTVRSPKSLQWTLEVQRQLGADSVLTVRYMGNHGYDIFVVNPNANASAPPGAYPNGFAGLPAATPDPRFGTVSQYTNSGYANYNGLLTSFRHAFRRGLQGQISYTWSHALDVVSNGGLLPFSYDSIGGQIDPVNLRLLNYSNADYDVRHNLSGDLIWDMPLKLKNRWTNAVLGGWSVGSKLSAHTGTPFSVSNGGSSVSFGSTVLAEVLDPNIRTTCGHSAIDTPCFTASQFTPADTQANFGNLPRNSFRGPGYFNLDSSLFKTVTVTERIRVVLGASAYNVLNHPNFSDPVSDITNPGLGQITGTSVNPSGPYDSGGPSGRAVVVTGRFVF
jgi:hypothetical protein